jgi:predicted esterase
MKTLCVAIFVWCAAVASAQVPAPDTLERGKLIEGLRCETDETQTYSLYLPSAYEQTAKWPVLLVFDPRGRSVEAAERFTAAAEEYGWIVVSSNDTRSDAGMEPNQKAIGALWPEIQRRYSADRERIYAAGFSGTVAPAMLLSKATGGIAGVIAAGGRYLPELLDDYRTPYFGAVGTTDFNHPDMRKVHRHLSKEDVPNRLVVFDGSHSWMPADVAYDGLGWFEVIAMKAGTTPGDDELLQRLLQRDMDAAKRYEAEDRPLDAMRRYETAASTYDGLVDVSEAKNRADGLADTAEVRRALKSEKQLEAREALYTRELQQVLDGFVASDPATPPDRLAGQLKIDDLKRQAAADGRAGQAAQRSLNMVFVATSFYVTRDLLARGQFDHAASALGVACLIRDDNPVVWYNRGCALARSGRRSQALDALERAVEVGFRDVDLMVGDADLASIRDDERFSALVAQLGGASAP